MANRRSSRLIPPRLLIGLASLVVALSAYLGSFYLLQSDHQQGQRGLWAAEWLIRDGLTRQMVQTDRASAALDQNSPVLIDIDENSLKALAAWPWSRSLIADLVEELIAQYGARLVVLDMVLPTPRDAKGDERLHALSTAGQLVLGYAFDYNDRPQRLQSGRPGPMLKDLTDQDNGLSGPVEQPWPAVAATGLLGHFTAIRRPACAGNIGFQVDADGALRRLPLVSDWQGQSYPSLGLASWLCASLPANQPGLPHADRPGSASPDIKTALAHLPTSPDGYLHLPFRWSNDHWISIPAEQILQASISSGSQASIKPLLESLLAGRIVLIGSSALGLSDAVATPLSATSIGALVHLQLIDALAHGRQFSPLGALGQHLITLVLLGLSWLGLRRWPAGLMPGLVLLAAAGSLVMLAGYQIHNASSLPVSPGFWGLVLLGLTSLSLDWLLTRRALRQVQSSLSRHLAPKVLQQVLQQQDPRVLEPRTTDITALVVDLEGFSTALQTSGLQSTGQTIRDFLTHMSDVIWQHQGTVDRYLGDGLLAYWGAPTDCPNQAALAMTAAQDMCARLDTLNQDRQTKGQAAVALRIGLAKGEALVGDFGDSRAANYTAIGSCINLAERLQKHAKQLGCPVLVDESVAASLQDQGHTGLTCQGPTQIPDFGKRVVYTLK